LIPKNAFGRLLENEHTMASITINPHGLLPPWENENGFQRELGENEHAGAGNFLA
jgi:hypothetical protein